MAFIHLGWSWGVNGEATNQEDVTPRVCDSPIGREMLGIAARPIHVRTEALQGSLVSFPLQPPKATWKLRPESSAEESEPREHWEEECSHWRDRRCTDPEGSILCPDALFCFVSSFFFFVSEKNKANVAGSKRPRQVGMGGNEARIVPGDPLTQATEIPLALLLSRGGATGGFQAEGWCDLGSVIQSSFLPLCSEKRLHGRRTEGERLVRRLTAMVQAREDGWEDLVGERGGSRGLPGTCSRNRLGCT